MKNILIIAGSDSVGGAGVQADLKTCEALGCYGANVITCVVAENTKIVKDIMSMPTSLIQAQLECIIDELNIDAVKIGMLFNKEIMQTIKPYLEKINAPIVLDPVCISKSGEPLIKSDDIKELRVLMDLADIATPNRFEFKELLNERIDNLPCDLLVKKEKINNNSIDIFYTKDGKVQEFTSTLLEPNMIHGSGCTLSTAIACFLANNASKEQAILKAKQYVSKAIQEAINTKFGKRILNHKAQV